MVVPMDEWTIKTPNPICRLFFQLTDFAAFCLTDFLDWRYTHLWLVFSTLLVNCCPPWMGRNYTCVLLGVAPLLDLLSEILPPPPLPNVQYIRTMCDCVGGGMKCTVDHFLQEFYTLFLTSFRTYKIASPPQTKMTSKDDIKGLVSLKFLRPCCSGYK